jgi:hypothetical protein
MQLTTVEERPGYVTPAKFVSTNEAEARKQG